MSVKKLTDLMGELGYEKFDADGFDAYEKGSSVVRFFWWSSREHGARLNVPRASLVVRGIGDAVHIPLVEWPSDTQPRRPWLAVAVDIRELVGSFEPEPGQSHEGCADDPRSSDDREAIMRTRPSQRVVLTEISNPTDDAPDALQRGVVQPVIPAATIPAEYFVPTDPMDALGCDSCQ